MSDSTSQNVALDKANQLNSFFDVSLDMLCIRDMSGRFVRLNKAWESALGYKLDELDGISLLSLIHPDDAIATRETMQRVNSRNEAIGFVNRYRARDGEYHHLEWRAQRSGDLVFGVARDVTARLALEAELQQAKAAAEAAARAKTEFLANMSHEIRTPLNGVIGVIDALSRTGLNDAQREMVGLVQSSGNTLERLVSDILDVSKIEEGRLDIDAQPFDLRTEFDGILDMNRIRAEAKNLAFRADFGETARGTFLGDSVRIKQVLGNLISNAVKFTASGTVAVRIGVAEPDCTEQSSILHFEVRDTGVGFDEQTAKSLFQRFIQADSSITRRFGGSGLGLSICRSLIELMGGEITAQSKPGRGSLFRCTIPLRRHRSLAAHDRYDGECGDARARSGLPIDRGIPDRFRVLLAEDHPINRKVIELLLKPHEIEMKIVEDGAAAVDAFKSGVFDIILMDMQLPIMDGLSAIKAIRRYEASCSHQPRTPIAILSGNAMAQHKADAVAAGADAHISKPVTAASLLSGIAEAKEAARDLAFISLPDMAARPHAKAVRQ